jgi:hypothetical protein
MRATEDLGVESDERQSLALGNPNVDRVAVRDADFAPRGPSVTVRAEPTNRLAARSASAGV